MAGVKGNSGGPRANAGRKPRVEEAELTKLLNRGWTSAQRLEMIKAWAARAARGDLEAGKLLMAYTFGKPTEKVEHTGKDGGPIEHNIQGQIDKVYGDSGEPTE
jgi:hypothetical protein